MGLNRGKQPGTAELLPLLVPSSISPAPASLQPSDLPSLLSDLALRFTPSDANDHEGGLEDIIGPLVAQCSNQLLVTKSDIGGGGTGGQGTWREYLSAVQSLAEVKGIASIMVASKNWNCEGDARIGASAIEYLSLLGPFLRLSTFPDAFVSPPIVIGRKRN
jgi:ubiquitin conjugation factor E4 B